MKKRSLYVINEHFEEILCSKVAIIADSLQGRERLHFRFGKKFNIADPHENVSAY